MMSDYMFQGAKRYLCCTGGLAIITCFGMSAFTQVCVKLPSLLIVICVYWQDLCVLVLYGMDMRHGQFDAEARSGSPSVF